MDTKQCPEDPNSVSEPHGFVVATYQHDMMCLAFRRRVADGHDGQHIDA